MSPLDHFGSVVGGAIRDFLGHWGIVAEVYLGAPGRNRSECVEK